MNNFGFGRPHSSDSWTPQRSFDLSSRMHSVPRSGKSNTRPVRGPYSSEFNFVESPLFCMHRNSSSSRNSPSPRTSMKGHESPRVAPRMSQTHSHSHELKRKMVFDLHEEAEKPSLSLTLEEISDADQINNICLSILASMMKSKNQRKYLHHMNNNALPAYESSGNITSNNDVSGISLATNSSSDSSIIEGKKVIIQDKNLYIEVGREKRVYEVNMDKYGTTMSEPRDNNYLDRVSLKRTPAQGPEKKTAAIDFEEYSKQSLKSRKQKLEEIQALKKLQSKLPPLKQRTAEKDKGNSSDKKKKRDFLDEKTPVTLRFGRATNISSGSLSKDEVPVVIVEDGDEKSHPLRKKLSLMSPEEALKVKWLRLTDKQIVDLENRAKAAGKDPGIHEFLKVDIDMVWK